jgi:hypothetical protein
VLEGMAANATSSHANLVVKNTFLEAQELDDFDTCRSRPTRSRFYSDSGVEYFYHPKNECNLNCDCNASTIADTDEEACESVHSDADAASGTAIQPPPGNWASAPIQPPPGNRFVPLCLAVIPVVVVNQQPVRPQKPSRSARRRRARAASKWYRYNAQLAELEDDRMGEFECEFQCSEDEASVALQLDEVDSWPAISPAPNQTEKIGK